MQAERVEIGHDHLTRARQVVVVLSVACLLVLAGCSQPVPHGMVRVRGRITFAGKALPEGTVNFQLSDGQGSASGRIEPDGSFTIVTKPGRYMIGVTSKEGSDRVDEKGNVTFAKRRIPERYESIATSGVQATVLPRGDRLSIELEQ